MRSETLVGPDSCIGAHAGQMHEMQHMKSGNFTQWTHFMLIVMLFEGGERQQLFRKDAWKRQAFELNCTARRTANQSAAAKSPTF